MGPREKGGSRRWWHGTFSWRADHQDPRVGRYRRSPYQHRPPPGQTHDSQPAPDLLEGMKQGAILLADKAYDSDAIREQLDEIDALATFRPRIAGRRLSLQQMTLPVPQSRRTFLQQTQTVQRPCNPIRQQTGKFPCRHQIRIIAHLDSERHEFMA